MKDNQIAIYKYGGLKVMLVTNENTIDEVLQAFEYVLKGSGFYINGHLYIVEGE
jgi:hypothetical protein